MRKVVRVAFTMAVCSLGLLLFGVWTRFEEYNLYQSRINSNAIPQALDDAGRHLLGSKPGPKSNPTNKEQPLVQQGATRQHPSKPNPFHSIILSVCCLPDYDVVEAYPQEYIDLFYRVSIGPLDKALHKTPLIPLNTTWSDSEDTADSDFVRDDDVTIAVDGEKSTITEPSKSEGSEGVHSDRLSGKLTTEDIALRFLKNGHDLTSHVPLEMAFELKNHDDTFIGNLIREIWLNARKLEVALSTTIDSHLSAETRGMLSVKWIAPHFDVPTVSVTTEHAHSLGAELVELWAEKTENVEETKMNEAKLERNKQRKIAVQNDIEALDHLIADAQRALPPLSGMSQFLALNEQRLQERVSLLSNELENLEMRHRQWMQRINTTQRYIDDAETEVKDNWMMVEGLKYEGAELWKKRGRLLDRLDTFADEWDRSVRETALYETYLLHKFHVIRDRQYNSSRHYFVEQTSETWECAHTAAKDFCGERVVECRAAENFLDSAQAVVRLTSYFADRHTKGRGQLGYRMVVKADDAEGEACQAMTLGEGKQAEAVMNVSCDGTAPCEHQMEWDRKGTTTLCLYVECDSAVPFAIYTQIQVTHSSNVLEEIQTILGDIENVDEETKNVTQNVSQSEDPLNISKASGEQPEGVSGSSLTMVHQYTMAVTVVFTLGAVIMSVFFLPRQ